MAYRVYDLDDQMQLGRDSDTLVEASERRKQILNVFPYMRLVIIGEGKMSNEKDQEK